MDLPPAVPGVVTIGRQLVGGARGKVGGDLVPVPGSHHLGNITLHYNTLHYMTIHQITLHHLGEHYSTLHQLGEHYITVYYITLHHLGEHYITLHYATWGNLKLFMCFRPSSNSRILCRKGPTSLVAIFSSENEQ